MFQINYRDLKLPNQTYVLSYELRIMQLASLLPKAATNLSIA